MKEKDKSEVRDERERDLACRIFAAQIGQMKQKDAMNINDETLDDLVMLAGLLATEFYDRRHEYAGDLPQGSIRNKKKRV